MKILEHSDVRNMLLGGARLLEINKDYVNSLNVFPVPDGDTGTNMLMTIQSSVNEINKAEFIDIESLVKAFAMGALRGARGNSGVILSQVIKGISDEFSEPNPITTKVFSRALVKATEVAYSAVTKPKEGTILTVIRYMAEQSKKIAQRNDSIEKFLKEVIKSGEEILAKTPDMLPILKQAGVVDAGGKGLLLVFQGFYNALAGVEMGQVQNLPELPTQEMTAPELATYNSNEAIINSLGDIKFGYCTEYFIVQLKPTATEEDIAKLRDKLQTIGDSVICIGDLSLVKVHVHTNQPNKALLYALALGEVDKIKIENMRQQNRELKEKMQSKPKKQIGMMTICTGDGIKEIFKDLTVDEIIEGGQTNNPSVDDILQYIEKINSDNVILFPNNKNIILAAQQAKELTKKTVSIIPTVNIAQGIRAALAFDPELSIEENTQSMLDAIADTKFGQITYAVKNTTIEGLELKEGDIIGLDDKKILAKGDSLDNVVSEILDNLVTKSDESITLYYGENVTEPEATALVSKLEKEYPKLDVTAYFGGQPHYFYFISIE